MKCIRLVNDVIGLTYIKEKYWRCSKDLTGNMKIWKKAKTVTGTGRRKRLKLNSVKR